MSTPKNIKTILSLFCVFAASTAQLAKAAAVTWTGAGSDMTWTNTANWSGGTPPGNTVIFQAFAFPASTNVLGATNNIVNTNMTIAQLWYLNTNGIQGGASNAYDETLINPNVTLTVTGNFYVGPNNSANATTVAGMAGTNCTLIVTNFASTFGVGYTNNANSVQTVTFTLADATNIIQVGTFAIGNSVSGNGRQSILSLGNSTNVINAAFVELGMGKAQGRLQFAGPNGGVSIAGTNGTRANMIIGRASSGSGGANGQLALTNYASVFASQVTNGWGAGDSSAGSGTGTITIQDGVFDVTTLVMGANTSGTQPATGTFNLGGGTTPATLIVNSPAGPGGGNFLISDANNGSNTGNGTLNINSDGTAEIFCNINKIASANNTGTINLNGGTLILENTTNFIGSTTPLDSLNLNGGIVQLSVDGNNTATANINATTISTSENFGLNVINIGFVTNILIPTAVHLMQYAPGNDPTLANFQVGAVPAGYTVTLEDNVNNDSSIDALVVNSNVVVTPLLWVGAVGNVLNNNWNFTTANWLNLTNGSPITYTNPDIVNFDDTASNSIVTLATNFLVGGIAFSNSMLNYTLNGPGSIGGALEFVMDGSAQVTLAETGGDSFRGGIAVNSGTVVLDDAGSSIGGAVTIGTGATLQIGNNDANGNLPPGNITDNGTLIFDQTTAVSAAAPIIGAGGVTVNGSGTVTLSSAANNYTGNTTVNAGTLAVTGSGTISNSQSVAVSGAKLDVSGVVGVTTLNSLSLNNAVLNVNLTNPPYLQAPISIVNGALTMTGAGNTINITALPAVASFPTPLTLIQAPYGINGFNMTLGTLPNGFTGYVTNENNTAVALVLTGGTEGTRPYVTWDGLDAQAGVTTNWSDAVNWELPGVPLPTDTVIFDTNDEQTASAYSTTGGGATSLIPANINNIVDENFTVSTLIFTNIGSAGSPSYQNTYINNGVTLTITNSLAIGSSSADYGSSAQENVSIAGTNGTLTVNNTNSTFLVGLIDSGGSGEQAALDMSGLGTFNASVSSFAVGAVATTANYLSGIAYLAATNTISAVGGSGGANEAGQDETLSFMVGETGKGASSETYLYLGQQNVINAWTIGVGIAKEPAELQFNPIYTGLNPTVTIVGGDGVSPVQVFAIGDGLAQSGGSTSPTGTADFSLGTVNALVSTMYIGRSPNASGPHAITGTLNLAGGTFTAATVYDGFQAYNTSDNGAGTINVNGPGTLSVGTLNLAWTSGAGESSPTTGALDITGGTVEVGTIAGDTNNLGQSSVSLSGATLIVSNAMGSSAAPLSSVSLQGTLQLSPNASFTNIVATSVTFGGPLTINITSIATSVGGTQQIPLISYLNGSDPTLAGVTLGTVPFGYSNASLVDDGISQIYLSITAPALLTWVGALSNGSLDSNWNTTDQNWLSGAAYSSYVNPDFVVFTDTASNSTVTVAAAVTPDSFNISNNVLNYVFNGNQAIGGTALLTKSGTASATLADTGGDSFTSGLAVNGGTLILDDANSSIGGNVSIAGGATVQLGNNDANGNLPGNITDNGTLTLDRANNIVLGNAISGTGTVQQIGTNTVTLSGGNTGLTGRIVITNGILNATTTAALGAQSATLIVTNTGSLDDNGISYNNVATPAIIVSGAGYAGAGAIINSGAQQTGAFSNITVAANVTFGGNNRWDIRAPSGTAASLNMSPPGTPYSITKVGTNEVSFVSVGTIDTNLGNIFVQQGELAIQLSTAQLGNPASNLIVSAGAELEMYGATTPLNKVITFNGNNATDSFKSDSDTSGQNVVAGPVTLNGSCLFDISSGEFSTFDNVISGSGSLVKITQGTLTLTNVNTYTGNTVISNGTLVLSGPGSILNSSNIIIYAGGNLNAASRTNLTLTLGANQTLSGFGSVTGLVSEASGSTITPGNASTIGTLTFGTNVTLLGTNVMKVSAVSGLANDNLSISGNLALGGTLNVTSLGGAYAAGNSFQLYTASGVISGAFSATNLPALPAGLGWVATNLVHGIVSIVATVNTNPTNITVSVNGNFLNLSWPSDHIGWRLVAQTNSLSNGLNASSNAWVTVTGSQSVNSESIPMDPKQPTVFYRLVYP